MPLVGIQCTHKRKNVSLDECLACAQTQKNPCKYAAEVVEGIKFFAESEAEKRKGMVSATSILGCVRNTFLCQTNDYYSPLDSLYWAFRGQIFHLLCEKFKQEGTTTEKRFYRTVGKLKISGKMDTIYPATKLLRDWKTTKMVPRRDIPYGNHVEQCNIYRWILAKPDNTEPVPIEKILVTYFDMNCTKTLECPIMDLDEVEKKILINGSLLQHAFETGEVPDVVEQYPTFWQCSKYCGVAKQCSKIWKMGQTK